MIDIVLVFNSAYYDKKFKIVCDKKQIAKDYLGSWFVIDFLSCIPLQLLALTSFNNLIKFTKISKFYRVLKVARLTRVLKLFKGNSKLFRNLQSAFKGEGWGRLLFAGFMFLLLCHIASCSWIIIANYELSVFNDCWLSQPAYKNLEGYDLYVASVYYTITTITTVGYGDIRAYSSLECIACIVLEITGVLGFSYILGAIAQIIKNADSEEAIVRDKMNTLTKIQQEHTIPHSLYREIKLAIQFTSRKND